MDRNSWLSNVRSEEKHALFVLSPTALMLAGSDTARELSGRPAIGLALLATRPGGVTASQIEQYVKVAPAPLMHSARASFPDEHRKRVIRSSGNYYLDPEHCVTDARQFELEVLQAEHARERNDPREATARALDALSFCSDSGAFFDLDAEIFRSEAERLRQLQLYAWWIFARSAVAIDRTDLAEEKIRPVVRALGLESVWLCYIWARIKHLSGQEQASTGRGLLIEMRRDLDLSDDPEMTAEFLRSVAANDQSTLDLMDEVEMLSASTRGLDLHTESLTSTDLAPKRHREPIDSEPQDDDQSPETSITTKPRENETASPPIAPTPESTNRIGRPVLLALSTVVIAIAAIAGIMSLTGSDEPEVLGAQIVTTHDFEDPNWTDQWMVSAEDIDGPDDDCYLDEPQGPLRTVVIDPDHGPSLGLSPNEDERPRRSEHLIASHRLRRGLESGTYSYSASAFIDNEHRGQTQTGSELSVQMTQNGLTTVAGLQAASNPWVNRIHVWTATANGVPGWVEVGGEQPGIFGEWVTVSLRFDTAADMYVDATVDAPSMSEPLVLDLSAFALPADARGFADGAEITVEAENLWSCDKRDPEEVWTTAVTYDDIRLDFFG